jgi:hypothetical protein
VIRLGHVNRQGWVLLVSGAAGGIAITMILDRIAS